jgi:hypothetical protein
MALKLPAHALRRSIVVALLGIGFGLVAVAVVVLWLTRKDLILATEMRPFDLLNVGVLILFGLALSHLLRDLSDREDSERNLLLDEVRAGREKARAAFVKFCECCEDPNNSGLQIQLNLSFKSLSMQLTSLDSLISGSCLRARTYAEKFVRFKIACTSRFPSTPTVVEKGLALTNMELLDQSLARLGVDIARRG